MKETITVDDALALLNSMVEADPEATKRLVEQRIPCNKDLTDHPMIQVQAGEVGLLGVINGLFGVDDHGWGPIAAQFEGDSADNPGALIGFDRSEKFRGTL